jgi:hypothetical protein
MAAFSSAVKPPVDDTSVRLVDFVAVAMSRSSLLVPDGVDRDARESRPPWLLQTCSIAFAAGGVHLVHYQPHLRDCVHRVHGAAAFLARPAANVADS